MPSIIDSLFLELGIDTSKFNQDQQKALAKIAEFEAKAKKSSKGSSEAIKTVGAAFRDLAVSSRISASAASIDNLASKFTMLGKSAQVAGIFGGAAAEGLGMLLSPVSLGIAAVGILGKEMWDLNKHMTDVNATIYRQAQLSGMNAANLWDWGEAARTVGANPQDVTGGVAALQTQIMGMGIGAGNATPQLIALARLGVPFNFSTGVPIDKLMARVHQMAMAVPLIDGVRNLGALRALTSPIMNDAMFNIATNEAYDPSQLKKEIKAQEPVDTAKILRRSLESQSVLGKLGIAKDILAETAYGGEQGLMQAMVTLLTHILKGINDLVDFFTHPKAAYEATVDFASRIPDAIGSAWDWVKNRVSPEKHKMSNALEALIGFGASATDAEAIVGNLMQESSLNPFATNVDKKGRLHVGLAQWDPTRQAAFAKRFGYEMGSSSVGEFYQNRDQLQFLWEELRGSQSAKEMAKVASLMGKTKAFMRYFENPGDNSLGKRFENAQAAMKLADAATNAVNKNSQVTVTNEVNVNSLNVHTTSSDPAAHADAVRKGLATHPIISPIAQGTVSLATRGMTQ